MSIGLQYTPQPSQGRGVSDFRPVSFRNIKMQHFPVGHLKIKLCLFYLFCNCCSIHFITFSLVIFIQKLSSRCRCEEKFFIPPMNDKWCFHILFACWSLRHYLGQVWCTVHSDNASFTGAMEDLELCMFKLCRQKIANGHVILQQDNCQYLLSSAGVEMQIFIIHQLYCLISVDAPMETL